VPDALAASYLSLYASDLDEHGRARPDAASAGPSRAQREEQSPEEPDEPELPHGLRPDAPR